jgi:hypothetical protein
MPSVIMLSIFLLDVTMKPIMLSVIMLNIVEAFYAKDKHSSLLGPFVNHKENEVL